MSSTIHRSAEGCEATLTSFTVKTCIAIGWDSAATAWAEMNSGQQIVKISLLGTVN